MSEGSTTAAADETGGETAVELVDVSKSYGSVQALSNVDLDIRGGTFHALVGANGSGKTTLFRIVLGLTNPSEGAVRVPADGVGCGFQRPNFYPDLTVAENVSVFASLLGANDADWREKLYTDLRLAPAKHRRAGDLSGGFAKKLDLALALLAKPDVLFLDEPLGDLDDVSKTRLLDFLSWYRGQGNAVVVSTHHLDVFDEHVDRLTILHDGEIVLDEPRTALETDEHGSLQELYVDRVVALERDASED